MSSTILVYVYLDGILSREFRVKSVWKCSAKFVAVKYQKGGKYNKIQSNRFKITEKCMECQKDVTSKINIKESDFLKDTHVRITHKCTLTSICPDCLNGVNSRALIVGDYFPIVKEEMEKEAGL